jgi:hypothetical protein
MQRHRVAFDGQMRLGTSSRFVSVSRYSLFRIEYLWVGALLPAVNEDDADLPRSPVDTAE